MKRNRYLRIKLRLFLNGIKSKKITFKKIVNALICNFAYMFKLKKSAKSPLILSIELWNECNAQCLFCRNDKGVIYNINPKKEFTGSISKGKMPLQMATDIIDQFADRAMIAVLYTNGEPLLYKDLSLVVQHATARGLMTLISSNGLLFNEQNAKNLLTAKLDFVKIQLSGFTQDTYSVQIRFGNVERLKKNIQMLVRLKKELKSETIILIDWIDYEYNKHQIPLIKDFCRALELPLNFRPGNPRGLEDKEKSLITGDLPLDISCDFLWKAMQFNYNGDVLQCCEGVVWAGLKPYAKYKIGDGNLKEIWNGVSAQNMRSLMKTKKRHSMPICKQCTRDSVGFKW